MRVTGLIPIATAPLGIAAVVVASVAPSMVTKLPLLVATYTLFPSVSTAIDVGGVKVGTTAWASEGPASISQWAGYRHPDGTVVLVGQSRRIRDDRPALPGLPLTAEELAAVARDSGFDLT